MWRKSEINLAENKFICDNKNTKTLLICMQNLPVPVRRLSKSLFMDFKKI